MGLRTKSNGSRVMMALAAAFLTGFSVLFVSVQTLAADWTVEEIASGVVYRETRRQEGPWAIQMLDILKGGSGLEIGVALGGEYVLGIEPLDHLAGRVTMLGRKAIAGINGDFYILKADPHQGDLIGFCVVDGELVSTPIRRSAVAFFADGTPVIDRFSFEGRIRRRDGETRGISGVNQRCPGRGIVLLTPRFNNVTRPREDSIALLAGPLEEPLRPDGSYTFTIYEKAAGDAEIAIPPHRVVLLGHGEGGEFLKRCEPGDTVECTLSVSPAHGEILHAVGGGPRLLRDGGISVEAETEGIAESFVETRHPRTAFGFNGERLFFVTVDGRREGYSAGMNLHELAELMKEIGAEEAINLDGGGSTTMWVQGMVRNRPSDLRIRPVANAVLIYEVSRE